MTRAIKEHWRDFAAILALLLVATGASAVILTQQRFRFPFIQDKPMRLYAELDNAQAVTPGQGQTVEVAGVKVGLIDHGHTALSDLPGTSGFAALRRGQPLTDEEVERLEALVDAGGGRLSEVADAEHVDAIVDRAERMVQGGAITVDG